MTSLIAWVAVDRSPSALYFASDSRISWGSLYNWDFGSKLFYVNNYPDIFGYCGDVLFPSQILSRVVALINSNSLFSEHDSSEDKFNKIKGVIISAFNSYPKEEPLPFSILHGTRIGNSITCKFELRSLNWDSINGFITKTHTIPNTSSLISSFGSGKKILDENNHFWQKTEIKSTSRSVYIAFCDALKTHKDPYTGGAPQLVTIQRDSSSKPLGVIFDGQQFISGLKVDNHFNKSVFQWYNECFENCDPDTGLILPWAQKQPRPRNT